MAQAGAYSPGPVTTVDVTVRVAGIPREYTDMRWAGDTTGGLPEQVVSAGTGMRSRTGSITWAPTAAVAVDPPHPLRRVAGWPPRQGDPVEINATVNGVTFRRFTGRIGLTTGSLVDGTLVSEITDTLGDKLRAMCTIWPRLTGDYTKSFQVAYQAMEQASLGVLPPPDADTVAHVAGQGGIDPQVGVITPGMTGVGSGDPYGVMASSGLRVEPTTTVRDGRDILAIGRASTVWDSTLGVSFTNGAELQLTHRVATHTLHAFVPGVGYIWEGPSQDTSPLPVLAFQILTSGVRIYTSPTTSVTVTSLSLPTSAGARWAQGTFVIGQSIRRLSSGSIGPSVVARVPRLPASWSPSALELDEIPATRGVENVRARTVVDAWSEATLASVWMDEFGKAQCVARDRLVTRTPSRSLYVDEKVFDGSWAEGEDSTRSGVVVTGQLAALQTTGRSGFWFTAYQESSIRGYEQDEPNPLGKFIEVPSDQDWGPIDTSFGRFGSTGAPPNAGLEGSWVGAVTASNASGDQVEQWAQFDSVEYLTSVQRLGQRQLKLTETISGIPAGKTLYLKTASTGTAIHPAMRGVPSPIIRVEWITTWADYTLQGATKGPEWAEPLELNAGWWLTPADAQRVADALAAEVTQRMLTFTRTRVHWDPRRQIGDVETWHARDSAGAAAWNATVLVTGYEESWEGRVPTQDVDVRVIALTDPRAGKTYTDLAAAYSTYSGMAAGNYQGVYDALPDAI